MPTSRKTHMAIGRHMMMIDKQLKKHLRDTLKAYDLGSTETMVLLHLLGSDGETQDQMIDLMGFDKGVMTRTMQGLEKSGYVIRQKHPKDLRAYCFFVTEKTKAMQGILFQAMEAWRLKVTQQLTEEDLNRLEQLLNAMTMTFNRVE